MASNRDDISIANRKATPPKSLPPITLVVHVPTATVLPPIEQESNWPESQIRDGNAVAVWQTDIAVQKRDLRLRGAMDAGLYKWFARQLCICVRSNGEQKDGQNVGSHRPV